MKNFFFHPFLALCAIFCACTVEHAEEQVLARHANGVKKTSIWVYPDGEVLKRNEWYNDGIKELEIPYKDNMPHGDFKRWTGFGDVAMTGTYKKGLRDGKWISYYVDKLNSRKKEAVRYYENDHPVGDWEGWHYNGVKSFEEHYNDKGERIGVWKKWDDKGTLIQEDACHPGTEKGYFKRYGNNCKILEYNDCLFGIKEGSYKLYYESFGVADSSLESCGKAKIREEGFVEHDVAMHPKALYRADGSIIKKNEYKSDVAESNFSILKSTQWFDENGRVIRESVFENLTPNGGTGVAYGLCEGSANSFCAETSYVQTTNPSGVLDSSALSQKEAFLKNIGKYKATIRYIKPDHKLLYEEFWDTQENQGQPELRESRSFYPDSMGGAMASEGSWIQDSTGKNLRNGIWRNWYASGIIRDSLTYVNGERIGEQFSYDSTGKLTIHKTENGKNRPVIMHILGE